MSKIAWNPGTLLAPVPPTLVSCGTLAAPAVLTVAWAGTLNTKPPRTYNSVRPTRHSYPILKETGEFVINLPPASLVRAVDLCGCKTGATADKFALAGLTAAPASKVAAPLIDDCPLCLECRVFDTVLLGSHEMFLADIVAVDVDEKLVDDAGRLHLDRAGLLAYAHGEYFALGAKVGSFGFSVRKKPKKPHGPRLGPAPEKR